MRPSRVLAAFLPRKAHNISASQPTQHPHTSNTTHPTSTQFFTAPSARLTTHTHAHQRTTLTSAAIAWSLLLLRPINLPALASKRLTQADIAIANAPLAPRLLIPKRQPGPATDVIPFLLRSTGCMASVLRFSSTGADRCAHTPRSTGQLSPTTYLHSTQRQTPFSHQLSAATPIPGNKI